MNTLTLRYSEDPTTGLPRLEDPNGNVGPADLEVLQREIDRHYERLIGSPDGQVLALNGNSPLQLPRHYRVTVQDRDRRSPTLLLESVEVVQPNEGTSSPEESPLAETSAVEVPEPPAPASPGRWQVEFLAEVAELVASARGESATRSPLDFVLGDLRALFRKDPRKLTLLLLAGYLHVGDTLCLRQGNASDNRYVPAARALAQVAGEALPEGVLGPLLAEPELPPEEPTAPAPEKEPGWLRKFFSFS